jgi:hypothetical protein
MAISRLEAAAATTVAAGAGMLAALTLTPGVAAVASAAGTSAGGCSATVHVDSQWGSGRSGGEVITVTVVNTAPTSGKMWTVTGSLAAGQQIGSAWNARITGTAGTSGAGFTAVNQPYNGALAPGASTTFGMLLSGTGPVAISGCQNDAVPASFSPSPSASPDVKVSEPDSGITVTLVVGQTLAVSLYNIYVPLTMTGTGLVELSATGGYPTYQNVAARYRAATPGTVDVISHTDSDCEHATPPCEEPVYQWRVHVNVVNPPSSGGQIITLTRADTQRGLGLHVGDQLIVSLPSQYDVPTLSSDGVLTRTEVVGGYPTGQPLAAHYVVVAPGRTRITAVPDNPCIHQSTPCPTPQTPWFVDVYTAA